MTKEEENKQLYVGNKIPLFIKIMWVLLVVWGSFYLVSFMKPNLMIWLSK